MPKRRAYLKGFMDRLDRAEEEFQASVTHAYRTLNAPRHIQLENARRMKSAAAEYEMAIRAIRDAEG